MTPNYKAIVDSYSTQLLQLGADNKDFESDGVPLALQIAGNDEAIFLAALGSLFELAQTAHLHKIDLWNVFHFGIGPMGQLRDLNLKVLEENTITFQDILIGLDNQKIDTTLVLQKGFRFLPGRVGNDPRLFREVLLVIQRLNQKKYGVEQFLQLAIEATATVSGGDLTAFREILHAFEIWVESLESKGLGFYYPFAFGLNEVAKKYLGMPKEFVEVLSSLLELLDILRRNDISLYYTFEYGLPSAFQASQNADDRNYIVECALELASRGKSPNETLKISITMILGTVGETKTIFKDFVRRLCEQGISSDDFFLQGWSWIPDVALHAEGQRVFLEKAERIFVTAVENKMNLTRIFRDGMGSVIHMRKISDIALLDFILRLVIAKQDPGIVLPDGLAVAIKCFSGDPTLVELCIQLANEELDLGIVPIAFLSGAAKAAETVGRPTPERIPELLNELHKFIVSLKEDSRDPVRLFQYGIRQVAENARGRPDRFLRSLRQIQKEARTLSEKGLNPEESLIHTLSLAVQESRSDSALNLGSFLAVRLRAYPVHPAELIGILLPMLLDFSDDKKVWEELFEMIENSFLQVPFDHSLINALKKMEEVSLTTKMTIPVFAENLLMLESLLLSSAARRSYVEHVLPAIYKANHREQTREAIASALVSTRINEMDTLHQEGIFRIVIPALLPAGHQNLTELSKSVPLWKPWLQEVIGNTDLQVAQIISVAIGRLCKTITEFFEVTSKLKLSQFNRPEFSGLSAAIVSGIVERVSRDAQAYVINFNGFFERVKPEFYANSRRDCLFKFGFPMIIQVVGKCNVPFLDCLQVVHGLAQLQFDTDPYGYISSDLDGLLPLFIRLPLSWKELVQPLKSSQGKGSEAILSLYKSLQSHLKTDKDLNIIKYIVTQKGVRAAGILHGTVIPALKKKVIQNLASHDETVRDFVEQIPFDDADLYSEFITIKSDPHLDARARRKKIEQLRDRFAVSHQAIVSGNVPPELAAQGFFSRVLYYVFPPSYSIDESEYAEIYRIFPERQDHVLQQSDLTSAPEQHYLFSEGSYILRSGEKVDPAPWEWLVQCLENSSSSSSDSVVSLDELGKELFQAWVSNELSHDFKSRLISQFYRHYLREHDSLPIDLENPNCLMKLLGFAEDSLNEIMQAALTEYYLQDTERFLQRAGNKMIPIKNIGRGLARSILKTIIDFQDKKIDQEAASVRLRGQLKGFDCRDLQLFSDLLFATKQKVENILASLKPELQEVDQAQVYLRIFQDFIGDQVAKMRRELFGDSAGAAKIEFKNETGDKTLAIKFQVTKRRSHSPIGFCEGVCTARDLQLWNTPEFMQVVFWEADQKALGGMHLLIVRGEKYSFLALPGINPTLAFLKRVHADEILNQVLTFASYLAQLWNLSGVCIPTAVGIHSNRAEMRVAIANRKFPVRQVTRVPFSYSPYNYTFSEVFEVGKSNASI